MLKKVSYSLVFTLFIFITIGVFLPRDVHVERLTHIQRPAVTVFTFLNGFRGFRAWSPWAKRDPGAVYGFSGPDFGVGATMSWSGDPRLVGSGWLKVTDSRPNSLVRMHLEIEQQGAADTYFQIDETAGGVLVTWGFDTDLLAGQGWFSGLIARYFGLFFDRWIGTDYETGLARLRNLVESMPPADFSGLEVAIVQVEPQDILYVSTAAGDDPADPGSGLAIAYREIAEFMAGHNIEMVAQPLAITRIRDSRVYDVEAAIPAVLQNVEPEGRVRVGRLPAGRALRVIHHGSYDRIMSSYEKLAAWMAAHSMAERQVSWEQYISNPRTTAAADLITHIYILLDDDR